MSLEATEIILDSLSVKKLWIVFYLQTDTLQYRITFYPQLQNCLKLHENI